MAERWSEKTTDSKKRARVSDPTDDPPPLTFLSLLSVHSHFLRQEKLRSFNLLAWLNTSDLSAVSMLCWESQTATDKLINLLPLKELSRLLTRALQYRCGRKASQPGVFSFHPRTSPACFIANSPVSHMPPSSETVASSLSSPCSLSSARSCFPTATATHLSSFCNVTPSTETSPSSPSLLPTNPTECGPKTNSSLHSSSSCGVSSSSLLSMAALDAEVRAARKIVACELIENNKLGFQASSGRVIWPHMLELISKTASIMREHEGPRQTEGLAVLAHLKLTERLCWLSVHARLCLDFISTSWLLCQPDLRYLAGRGLLFAPEFSWTSRFPVSCQRHLSPKTIPPAASPISNSGATAGNQPVRGSAAGVGQPQIVSAELETQSALSSTANATPPMHPERLRHVCSTPVPPLTLHLTPHSAPHPRRTALSSVSTMTPSLVRLEIPAEKKMENSASENIAVSGKQTPPKRSCFPPQQETEKDTNRIPPLLRSLTFPQLTPFQSNSSTTSASTPATTPSITSSITSSIAPSIPYQPSRACLNAHAWLYHSSPGAQAQGLVTPPKSVSATVSAIQSAMEEAETSVNISCDTNAHCLKCHPLAYLTQRCVFDCLTVLKRFEKGSKEVLHGSNQKANEQEPLHAPEHILSIIVYVAAFMPHILLPAQQRVARLIVMHLIRKPSFSACARAQTVRAILSTPLITDPQILNEVLVAMHDHDKERKIQPARETPKIFDAETEVDFYLAAHTAYIIDP